MTVQFELSFFLFLLCKIRHDPKGLVVGQENRPPVLNGFKSSVPKWLPYFINQNKAFNNEFQFIAKCCKIAIRVKTIPNTLFFKTSEITIMTNVKNKMTLSIEIICIPDICFPPLINTLLLTGYHTTMETLQKIDNIWYYYLLHTRSPLYVCIRQLV